MNTATDAALLMDRHAYQVSHLIAGFTVPLLRTLYHQFDGDLAQVIVLGEISLRNVSQFFDRGGAGTPEKLLDDRQRRDQLMQSCNALSISEATGIPRETVRRKVALLIDKGWLYRDTHQRLMVSPRGGAGFTRRNAQATHDILELAHKLSALLKPVNAEQD